MENLTRRDFRGLVECVRSCSTPRNFETFVSETLYALEALIPCELAAFCEMNPARRISRNWLRPIDFYPPAHDRIWPTVMHEHPVLSYNAQTRDGRAHKVSDFQSAEKFKRGGLYNQFYRPINVSDVLCFAIPSPRPYVLGFAFHRDRRSFTERERMLLNLLRPHLATGWQNSKAFTRMEDEIRSLRQGIQKAGLGVIMLFSSGQVRLATDCARQWLREFLGYAPRVGKRLPEELGRWIRQQEDCSSQEHADRASSPLIIQQGGKRLVIRLMSDSVEKLLLLERQDSAVDLHRYQRYGLTPRETEVLGWVAQGKSNRDIAAILGTSPRTVQKHLERVFQKLGVDNRTAAARAFPVERAALL
jgi:DNA-binding CsgD family transcriptional regulator